MDRILDDLNDAQRTAVLHPSGPMMVLAGAGSGKTRVITRRVARLLRDGVAAHRIVAVTFTNKAAQEMAHRIQQLGGTRVLVSTFHAMCARFLRTDGHRLGYPRDFTIYDTYDRDTLLKNLVEELSLGHFDVKPAAIGRRISQLKNQHMRPEGLIVGLGDVDRVVEVVYGPYEARMRRLGALDFDDLLLRFLDLLNECGDVAELYQSRIEHLLVDEFQDTNPVQYALTRALAAGHRNLCVVGDPDQSIYRFRGAELRNMLEFERDYPDAVTIALEANYRSTATILHAAQSVIERNRSRLPKVLLPTLDDGEPIRVSEAPNEDGEAQEVAGRVARRIRDGVSPSEIAIFYRTHFVSRVFEKALRTRAIPYQVVGGLTFFERREIKDLLAYLRVVVNPLDDVATERIVNVPPRGVGRTTLAKLRTAAAEQGMSLAEAVTDPQCRKVAGAKARSALAELGNLFEELRASTSGVEARLQLLLERTEYVRHTCELGDPEDEARRENIAELVSDTATFDRDHGGTLGDYLSQVALQTSDSRGAVDGEPRVSLMTVHAAKGLEFDHVHVVALEEKLFPHSRSEGSDEELEEERRLFYVALTRARRTVELSHATFRMIGGRQTMQEPSRFFAELPPGSHRSRPGGGVRETRPAFGRRFTLDDDYDGGHGDGGADPLDDVALDQSEFTPLQKGARVAHRHFGSGSVLRVAGVGIQSRATVRFDDGSERELLLEYAGLRVLERGRFERGPEE